MKNYIKDCKEILEIEIDADIDYKLVKLTPIRQKDVYEDFVQNFLYFWKN